MDHSDLSLSLNADGQYCCAWVAHKQALGLSAEEAWDLDMCGVKTAGYERGIDIASGKCCELAHEDSWGDCERKKEPNGVAYDAVFNFMFDEDYWLYYYSLAW